MKKTLLRDILILIAFFGAIWYIFKEFDIFPDKERIKFSIEKEEELGKKMLENILKDPDFQKITDSVFDSVFFVMKKRLVDAVDKTDFDYNFILIENSMVNAFAIPGGNILVTSGLIEFTKSPEELASVLAHEMGHVEGRDVMKKIIKELGISLIMSDDVMVFGEVSRTATSTIFDRKQEAHADKFALELMQKAKINPRILATFFRRIKDEVGAYDERFEILMNHPHVNSRIKMALEYKIPEGFKTEPFDINWDRIKLRIAQ